MPNSSILIREGKFIVKNITDSFEKIQAYYLRHRIFCQELAWVQPSADYLEIDRYDKNAVFFGVFDKFSHKLLAFLRLIIPEGVFMLEQEFSLLVEPNYIIRKKSDTVEVSRLCVAPEARDKKIIGSFGIYNISMFLYKGVYQWCIKNHVRYLYLVVEHKIYRLLRIRGFPCKMIGKPIQMDNGVVTVAAIMDWREFETLNTQKQPEIIKWFMI